MDVQGLPRRDEAENQAARSVLVFGIILDNLAICYGFTDRVHADSAQDGLVDGMSGELELVLGNLVANLLDDWHAHIIYSPASSMRGLTSM